MYSSTRNERAHYLLINKLQISFLQYLCPLHWLSSLPYFNSGWYFGDISGINHQYPEFHVHGCQLNGEPGPKGTLSYWVKQAWLTLGHHMCLKVVRRIHGHTLITKANVLHMPCLIILHVQTSLITIVTVKNTKQQQKKNRTDFLVCSLCAVTW